ncbi:amidohydrolase [Fulvivirgaceae bacterium BMA12]|uniref:Amidohydrolase n=1 Tax=Agaribacillus aureus TaxID=3051825 RepID=A0ABT8L9X6_9BACT|nr:amidohydrolase [Fulvivirgaceae bacterium BMA12]
MQDLAIALIQSDLHWHDVDANLAMFEEKIWQIPGKPDIILLPEMFNSGFTNATDKIGEMMNMKTFRWMKQQAAQTQAVIAGSLIVKEHNQYYNRLIWMQPNGDFESYDKRHLFRMAEEHHYFEAGKQKLLVEVRGWKICPMICYDLRFPVWIRNQWQENQGHTYDLLIFVANWPAKRINAWDTLLKARAIENLSYVAGLGRIGKDGNDIAYNGHSAVIDPLGKALYFSEDRESIETIVLSKKNLEKIRSQFPAFRDADSFRIE